MSDTALKRVLQIAVNVKDLKRAVAFYRDVLGLRFLFEAPPQLAFFDCGGVRLMLTVPETKEIALLSSMIYFQVGDIDATYARLSSAGARVLEKPVMIAKMSDHDLWLAAFYDSEGNMLGIMEERR
jgi:methylmalonyl-CoA/ethylmalonyl-CoA epimerase